MIDVITYPYQQILGDRGAFRFPFATIACKYDKGPHGFAVASNRLSSGEITRSNIALYDILLFDEFQKL